MVSNSQMVMMTAAGAVCALLPIGVYLALKKGKGIKLRFVPALTGVLTFVVFVYFLENALHVLVSMVFGGALESRPWLYALYGALAAGVFEETGRLAAFRLLKKKHPGPECAVSYGIGHGGIECVLMVGVNFLVAAAIILLARQGVIAENPAVEDAYSSEPAWMYGTAALERVSAFLLHIGLSVFVWSAVNVKGRAYCYPLAILLHALVDLPAALYQLGRLNLFAVEAFALVIALAVLYAGIRLYRSARKIESGKEVAGEPAM